MSNDAINANGAGNVGNNNAVASPVNVHADAPDVQAHDPSINANAHSANAADLKPQLDACNIMHVNAIKPPPTPDARPNYRPRSSGRHPHLPNRLYIPQQQRSAAGP